MKKEKKKKGKYVIMYSNGIPDIIGKTETDKAIAKARKEGLKDPELKLLEMTTDLGGCVISWKPRSRMDRLREAYSKISAFLYSKLRRLIVVGRALGLG